MAETELHQLAWTILRACGINAINHINGDIIALSDSFDRYTVHIKELPLQNWWRKLTLILIVYVGESHKKKIMWDPLKNGNRKIQMSSKLWMTYRTKTIFTLSTNGVCLTRTITWCFIFNGWIANQLSSKVWVTHLSSCPPGCLLHTTYMWLAQVCFFCGYAWQM